MAEKKSPRLGIIFLTIFIDLVGFGIVIPVLPLYALNFGANELINGFLLGIYSGMQFFSAPLLGKLSDRVGRRPVLLASLIGTSLGFLLMGIAPMLSGVLIWLFVARIIDGISGGNISTAQAYIADITTPEERSKAMGLIGAAFGLGFVFGPAIGGVMSHFSISAPFYFAAFLAALNAVAVFFLLPESLSNEHRPEKKAPMSEVFQHGWHLPALMGCFFLATAGFSIMCTIFALFTNKRFGYDQTHNGYIFTLLGLVGALVQGGLLRQLLKRGNERGLAISGILFQAVGVALLPFSHSLSFLLFAACLVGIGNSLVTPTLNGLASRSAARGWQGRVIGLMQSSASLARWVGPFAAGQLLMMDAAKAPSLYGQTPLWTAAGVLLIAFVLAWRLPAKPITVEG